MGPVRNQGLLIEVPPVVLFYGSVWVIIADGIFAAMGAFARTGGVFTSLAAGLVAVLLLGAASLSRPISIVMSGAAALVFGGLIYHISKIPLLAVIVLIQIGLMHLVAFSILRAHRKSAVTPAPPPGSPAS